MGSLLGPVLANIFVGYNENKLFDFSVKPQFYKRYVDDTFAIFENEAESDEFFNILNTLNPTLKFTSEKEESESLAFLDVKIQKSDSKFITSVYRKPTFTGQYIQWDSFGPSKRKKNLISTLVDRVVCICSKSLLQQELENIRVILRDNGYPESIIDRGISNKLARFQSLPKFGPNKCPAYLNLPWIGNISLKFENKIKSSVKHCFRAVEPLVLFSTEKSFHPSTKMLCLPFNKVWSYTSMCATVIASTWAAHFYVWRKESINMLLILSEESNNQQKLYQN